MDSEYLQTIRRVKHSSMSETTIFNFRSKEHLGVIKGDILRQGATTLRVTLQIHVGLELGVVITCS